MIRKVCFKFLLSKSMISENTNKDLFCYISDMIIIDEKTMRLLSTACTRILTLSEIEVNHTHRLLSAESIDPSPLILLDTEK